MSENEAFVHSITTRIEEAKKRPAQEFQHRHIIVLLGGVRYAIPMQTVLEIVRTPALTPIPGARSYVQGIFFHRGAVIPVIDIPKRFQSGGVSLRVPEHIIIVRDRDAAYGFLVDHVVDALECPPETMKTVGEHAIAHLPSPYLSGVWEHTVTIKGPPFHYDFLIAGPSIQEKYREDSGDRTIALPTFLLSIGRMVDAIENDAFEAMIQ